MRRSATLPQFPAFRRNRKGDASQKVAELFSHWFLRGSAFSCHNAAKSRDYGINNESVRGQTNCNVRHVCGPHIHFAALQRSYTGCWSLYSYFPHCYCGDILMQPRCFRYLRRRELSSRLNVHGVHSIKLFLSIAYLYR